MKAYLMQAEHYNVPGIVVRICATRQLAVAEALACANIMLSDANQAHNARHPLVDTEDAMTSAIEKLQEEHGAAHCYVEISEHDVIGG